jgi:hypothetical protein
VLKDISSHGYYVNLALPKQTRTMTRIKKSDNISPANGNKRKGRNENTDSKEMACALSYNNSDGAPRIIKMGQTIKKEKRNEREPHTKYMAAQDKGIERRRGNSSILVSHTPKRNISNRNSIEKETNNDTRELVLPSDSNVVKGNV